MNGPTTQQVDVAGIATNIAVAGNGPPIIFLHGWGANIGTMWPVATRLTKQGFCVHVLDLPGFGETALPPAPWDVMDYAQWVLAYLDMAQLDRVSLVGHSFGGRISLVLGADYPYRIHKIALSNSAGVKLPPSWDIRLYYLGRRVLLTILSLPGLGSLKERTKAYLRRRFGSSDYLNAGPLTETFRKVIAKDLLPYARRVQAPTLLFWGDQDQDTPLRAGKILEQAMPDAGLVVFEGAGHYAYLDEPTQFVAVVSHFFKDEKKPDDA